MLKEVLDTKSMLHTQALSVGYTFRNGKYILQARLELQLFKGDFVCLIGPNGCGKSTLIRTLGGLQSPIAGEVFIHDKKLSSLGYNKRSRLLNTVLTDRTVVGSITVEEVVALGRYSFTNWIGSLTDDDKNFMAKAIKEVGLSGFEERKLETLSDGERQRVFIAKALASDAPVMLLDEPTAHLDISNRVEILILLRDLSATTGHACLVSTHDLGLALQLADEIWLMLPGKGMICCTPEEIMQEDHLDKVFGNSAVFFDPVSGNFTLRGKSSYLIRQKENTDIPDYALKTFARLGFSVTDSSEALAVVGKNKEGWMVITPEAEWNNLSLSGTCRILKKLTLKKN